MKLEMKRIEAGKWAIPSQCSKKGIGFLGNFQQPSEATVWICKNLMQIAQISRCGYRHIDMVSVPGFGECRAEVAEHGLATGSGGRVVRG